MSADVYVVPRAGFLPATAALVSRNSRLLANPRFVVAVFIVPLVYFAGFAAVLHTMLKSVVDFPNFLPPAILVQVAMDTAITSAFFLAGDRRDGIVTRMLSLPISSGVFPLARLTVDGIRFLLSAAVVMVAAFALGFRFSGSVADTVGFWVIAVWFAVVASCGAAVIGLRSTDPEAVSSALYVPYLPLLTLSTALVPLELFPEWIRPVVHASPISVVVDNLRHLAGGTVTWTGFGQAAAWLTGLSVVLGLAAVSAFRRAR